MNIRNSFTILSYVYRMSAKKLSYKSLRKSCKRITI